MNPPPAMDRPALDRVGTLHPHCNLGGFIESTRRVPGFATAIIDQTGPAERTISYDHLEDAVRRAVGAFRSLHVVRGDRIAVVLPNSSLFLVAFLGLMRLGAIPVFVNPKLPKEVIRFVLGDSRAAGVLADLDDNPAHAALANLPDIRLCLTASPEAPTPWRTLERLLAKATPDPGIAAMAFDDQAFQPYTAGSTGTPKGIVLTHGGMLWGIEHSQMYWPRNPAERGIVAAPMFHKNAMRGTIKPMLRAGASVVIMRAFAPRPYLEAVARFRVTICGGVPAMFADILRETELLVKLDLSAIETLSMGSSAVPQELSSRLRTAFPRAAVKESYGLTEGGGPTRAHPDGRPTPPGSVGVIAPEYEATLVDAAGRRDAASGELHLRSPYVLKAYAGLPELTAARLYDGWLRTGDVFRIDADRFLYFLGRTDDMFSCGGENVYPKEVENLILGHPDVSDVIVVPLPHATKGFAPTALVTPRPGRSVDVRAIQDFCAAHGPAFTIPRAILVTPDLPRTDAGKPDRKAAATLLSQTFGTLSSTASGRRASP